MLGQLIPNSSVTAAPVGGGLFGGLSSGMASLGGGLLDDLGSLGGDSQTLRIIPELRLNALFVSGPQPQVREVEEMLRVLDSNEWPDTYRDKYSRMIAIEHAEASQVFEIVKDVYKVYLEDQEGNNRRRGGDMLAAFMGGGGGRSSGRSEQNDAPPARLAVGVDTSTNHLIVWADEPLFREIEGLVQSIDNAAYESRRTIQVISLQNTSSASMMRAVDSLMPRVNVSTTGTARESQRSDSSSPSPSSSRSSDSSRGERSGSSDFRSFFEQRMRERAQEGGSSGGSSSPGGSGGSSDRSSGFGSGRGSFGGFGGDRGSRGGGSDRGSSGRGSR